MAIGIVASITNLISITPNNVGIQEIAMGYLVSLTGVDFNSGIVGAGIIRVLNMGSTFILAPIFSYILLNSNRPHLMKSS